MALDRTKLLIEASGAAALVKTLEVENQALVVKWVGNMLTDSKWYKEGVREVYKYRKCHPEGTAKVRSEELGDLGGGDILDMLVPLSWKRGTLRKMNTLIEYICWETLRVRKYEEDVRVMGCGGITHM